LNNLAHELDTSLAKLAIAWCAKNPNVSTVILGASKVAQLSETLDSLAVIPLITDEVSKRIENIVNNKPVLRIL
jgi:aryl-alcohol dehydrogenase-like predicted oxidoreductase